MVQQDFYKVLGISRQANEQQIRNAYRTLARQYHPDVNHSAGAEERFKRINEAYQVLSDPDKRRRYDRFGAEWERYKAPDDGGDATQWFAGATRSSPGARGSAGQAERRSTGASFESIFRTRQQTRNRRGEDHEVPVEISLREAFSGTTRVFDVRVPSACPACDGSGLHRSGICFQCEGSGKSTVRTTLEVTIPAAIREGHRVRVAGKGGPGIGGGPAGDVYLRVGIRPDPEFVLDDVTLRTDVDVPMYTALLGGEVLVRTLTGKVALTIPEATQNGRVFRLRGQGWPTAPRSEMRGDLLAKVSVRLPQHLSDDERTTFTRLRRTAEPGEGRSSA